MQLVQRVGRVLGLLPQSHCPWVSTAVLFPPLHVGPPLGFVPEAALEGLGLDFSLSVGALPQ